MTAIPTTNIGGIEISRVTCGTNPFNGFSHFSKARDDFMRAHFTKERIVEVLKAKQYAGQRYAIVVVSEGAREAASDSDSVSDHDCVGLTPIPGGIAKAIEKRIEQGTGGEVRSVVLSHLQRGGIPCAYDRRIAREFGIAAVQLLEEGRFGRMVSLQDGQISSIEIPRSVQYVVKVDVAQRYDAQNYNARFSLV